MTLHFYNTLTREKEAFESLEPGKARMYTCGPTVYRYPHIGNMRTFLFADLVRRTLEYNGYAVEQVMNITDVGHMAEEAGLNIEAGEDRIEAAARTEQKSPEEIAEFYTGVFLDDLAAMNIQPAHHYPRATDHIEDMLDLTGRLVENGKAYERDGFVYYAVGRFEAYGNLSGNTLDALQEGHRVDVDSVKENPADFTLWRAAGAGRLTTWDSPWGPGFPGWHIECSAMSMCFLGDQLDIHTGGEDLVFPHHENEIAQSEGATGKRFVQYWMHGAHLLAEGRKMAKQTGNVILLRDIAGDAGYLSLEAEGIEPMAFRLLCFTVHYRHKMNVTWETLRGQQTRLERLRRQVAGWMAAGSPAGTLSPEAKGFAEAFREAVNDDLAMPQALNTVWETTKAGLPDGEKLALLLDFDRVLGLRLDEVEPEGQAAVELTEKEHALVEARGAARAAKDWAEADRIRDELAALGLTVTDTAEGPVIERSS